MKLLKLITGQKMNRFHVGFCFDLNNTDNSDDYKEKLIEDYIQIMNDSFIEIRKFKFNIYGSGYGLSKGSQLIGVKAMKNKFAKRGYGNCKFFSIENEQNEIVLGFSTERVNDTLFNGYLGFNKTGKDSTEFAINFFSKLNKVFKLEYGYGFECYSDFYHENETYPKYSLLGSSISSGMKEFNWRNGLGKLKQGWIRKLFSINVFNSSQMNELKFIDFDEISDLDERLKVALLSKNKIKKYQKRVKNKFF